MVLWLCPAGASVARRWYDGGHDDRGHHAGALDQVDARRITSRGDFFESGTKETASTRGGVLRPLGLELSQGGPR